ncbi:MerR family DNA-binding transcriptional regulator, partial [Nocardia farcinica]|uniref:MerR family DNA-binding transcriptional regulator n=1 Tax=Nocardia farcinica TaxID=37329 RepID=UPI0024588888
MEATASALSTVEGGGGGGGAAPGGGRGLFLIISGAAMLAGSHAHTLRTYDRIALVTPKRTSGGGRRYS